MTCIYCIQQNSVKNKMCAKNNICQKENDTSTHYKEMHTNSYFLTQHLGIVYFKERDHEYCKIYVFDTLY